MAVQILQESRRNQVTEYDAYRSHSGKDRSRADGKKECVLYARVWGEDKTDDKQRMEATHSLLDKVSWTGTTPFMSDLAKTRTKQLSEEMNVPKELMDRLFLTAGGRGTIGTGGGSDNELTNWDGTKKRNGWGM